MTTRLINSPNNKLSKLHLYIKNNLNLENLGFVSEQRILRYCVDELNELKKIIIEINGDHVHANPKIYDSNEYIVIGSTKILAKEKWSLDLKRKEILESLGYTIFVIWESDDLDQVKLNLQALLNK